MSNTGMLYTWKEPITCTTTWINWPSLQHLPALRGAQDPIQLPVTFYVHACSAAVPAVACCLVMGTAGIIAKGASSCSNLAENAHHHVCCDQKPSGNCSFEGRGQKHVVTHIIACTTPCCAQAARDLQPSYSHPQILQNQAQEPGRGVLQLMLVKTS